jgi:hypothetical protein
MLHLNLKFLREFEIVYIRNEELAYTCCERAEKVAREDVKYANSIFQTLLCRFSDEGTLRFTISSASKTQKEDLCSVYGSARRKLRFG